MKNSPHVLDLFPELPLPPLPTPAPRRKPRATATPAEATLPVAMPQTLTPAAMAEALQGHPDYRIQRRLKPTLDWPLPTELPPDGPCWTVLILDTETTGLDPQGDSIIELALLRLQIRLDAGLPVGPVAVFDALEDPGRPIPREVVSLTGITDADVRGQRLDDAAVLALLDGVDLVIAHNAGFDRPFVERRYPAFAAVPWACSFADIPWKSLGRGSAKLESLAQAAGWFYDAHRAEMDCHALLAVLAQPLPGGTHTGLYTLVQAVQRPQYRLLATYAPFEGKDKLKARGYRWNGEQRVWHTRLADGMALQQELLWLRDHVYGPKGGAVQVEEVEAVDRYSGRSGRVRTERLPSPD